MSRSKQKRTTYPYQDPSLGTDERTRDLLSRMSLDQKLRQMVQINSTQLVAKGRVTSALLRKTFGKMSVGTLQDPRQDARTNVKVLNALQTYLRHETKWGIPALVISECLHGHMSPGATVYPQAIGLASTWNPALVCRMAAAAAREARAVGVAQALSPVFDLARDPRWGRVEETYGEDPYLVERMGVAYVRGIQGRGAGIDEEHLVATAKHYAAHGSPEAGVNLAPVAVGPRELREVYLPPFEAAIREAGALSVMPAYSELDGVPCSASKFLLTEVLRDQWGFSGYVYSDYGAIHMLQSFHRTARNPAEAGKQALLAGMDLEAPEPYGFGGTLKALVRKGEIDEGLIDQAVERILRVKFLAGLFENPFGNERKAMQLQGNRRHRRLALSLARESIVLLKNAKDFLPLKRTLDSVAVIGPNATGGLFGDYCFEKETAVAPLEGIRGVVSRKTRVIHAKGCGIWERSRDGFAEAVDAAREADVAVLCVGGSSSALAGVGWGAQRNWNVTCGEGFDRHELGLPGVQQELVEAVCETGTPVVVVLLNGRPYTLPWVYEHVPAVLEAWYSGEAGGTAVAEVLFGKVNPSGRLPISVPRSVGHVPAFHNHKPSARGHYHRPGTPEQPGRDYVFAETTPQYPFGHGLSYTSFKYSNLRITPRRIREDGKSRVTVDVSNTGARAGKETVQLYVNDVVSTRTTPVRVLRAFRKVPLRPGETKTVQFSLGPRDLSFLDDDYRPVVEPGKFEIMIGKLKRSLTVV